MRHIVALLLGIFALAGAQNTSAEGIWQGSIQAGAIKLRLAFHISKDDKGGLLTKWDSIDQGAKDLPTRQTTFTDKKLHIEINAATKFDGTMSDDGSEIAGTFTQGAAIPLRLKRVDKVETLNRPQEPKGPFPYNSEDVTYRNEAAGITLGAT